MSRTRLAVFDVLDVVSEKTSLIRFQAVWDAFEVNVFEPEPKANKQTSKSHILFCRRLQLLLRGTLRLASTAAKRDLSRRNRIVH